MIYQLHFGQFRQPMTQDAGAERVMPLVEDLSERWREHHRGDKLSAPWVSVLPARGARWEPSVNTTYMPSMVTTSCLFRIGGWPIQPVRVHVGLK